MNKMNKKKIDLKIAPDYVVVVTITTQPHNQLIIKLFTQQINNNGNLIINSEVRQCPAHSVSRNVQSSYEHQVCQAQGEHVRREKYWNYECRVGHCSPDFISNDAHLGCEFVH